MWHRSNWSLSARVWIALTNWVPQCLIQICRETTQQEEGEAKQVLTPRRVTWSRWGDGSIYRNTTSTLKIQLFWDVTRNVKPLQSFEVSEIIHPKDKASQSRRYGPSATQPWEAHNPQTWTVLRQNSTVKTVYFWCIWCAYITKVLQKDQHE